jgi:hypothetical protein
MLGADTSLKFSSGRAAIYNLEVLIAMDCMEEYANGVNLPLNKAPDKQTSMQFHFFHTPHKQVKKN